MIYLLLQAFGIFIPLLLVGFLIRELAGKITLCSPDGRKAAVLSPFVELDVKPVSDGDTVCYAYMNGKRYTALVENKNKHAKLNLEAGSKKELEKMVSATFRAWGIAGRKKV